MNKTSLKTVGQLIKFLQQFPSNARILINSWDCYNDEPYTRELSFTPFIEEKKNNKVIYF